MLGASKASLDPIALLIKLDVVRDEDVAIAFGRDHRQHIHSGDALS